MECKWERMKRGRQSDYNLADCLGACHCDRCTQEAKKDEEIVELKRKLKLEE